MSIASRCLCVLTALCLSGCGNEVAPPQTTVYGPEVVMADGWWTLSVDSDGNGRSDSLACIVVDGWYVTQFRDGCVGGNLLISYPYIFHDDTGPWFSVQWAELGDVTFYFTYVGSDRYLLDIHLEDTNIWVFGEAF